MKLPETVNDFPYFIRKAFYESLQELFTMHEKALMSGLLHPVHYIMDKCSYTLYNYDYEDDELYMLVFQLINDYIQYLEKVCNLCDKYESDNR